MCVLITGIEGETILREAGYGDVNINAQGCYLKFDMVQSLTDLYKIIFVKYLNNIKGVKRCFVQYVVLLC